MDMHVMCRVLAIAASLLFVRPVVAQDADWYSEGDFAPTKRLKIQLVNTLNMDRKDCPVIIPRDEFPLKRLHEMWVTVVDPSLPIKEDPSKEEIAFAGMHGIRKEANGHQVFYQLDDLDKDGIWDELFFQTDIKAKETKTLYVYVGFSSRGWNPHGTHATIGSYCRHIIAWWESANIGWKLWYPTSVDMYGKRKPVLMSEEMCIKNLCGYNGVPKVNFDFGSDIMGVATSFGAGGIGLFEHPGRPDSISVPRFTPIQGSKISDRTFNEDQMTDTRYAFDVVVNGPLRSTIRVKTMNWMTGYGSYELVQDYTAYTNQSYSTSRVKFTQFLPSADGVTFACGIKAGKEAKENIVEKGIAIRMGRELVGNPGDDTGIKEHFVEFIGSAIVVKGEYKPEYQHVPSLEGNHTFRIAVNDQRSFEYMIAGAWSEGIVYNTPELFIDYVRSTSLEYNSPLRLTYGRVEGRPRQKGSK